MAKLASWFQFFG